MLLPLWRKWSFPRGVVVTRPVWEVIRDLIRLGLKQVRWWHIREYFRASGQLSLYLNMVWSIYSFYYIRSFGLVL